MVDILLTHSYHLLYDPKQVRKMQPYPPLGTLYAAAVLRQRGYSVAVFDSMLEDPECGFPAAVARHRPRVVAIYEDNFNFLSKMCLARMREVAFGMLEAARASGATVVVNGSDSSDHTEEYLRRGFEFVLLGEAEWTLFELLDCLFGKRKPENVLGLAFIHHESEKVIRTPPRPLTRNLDSFPLPARDLVDLGRYREAWKSAHGFFSLNVVAGRGCPFRCNWCARPIYGQSFHLRSAESVADEMLELRTAYGAEHLWFADDVFGLKARWVRELADCVEKRAAAVAFKMQSRVDLMTEETVGALRRAGCAEVWMGVESGSQRILDAMEKGTRVEEIRAARSALGRNDIRACFFVQFGYPGETWEDIKKTIELVRQTRPDDIGVSVSYPLPGTKFYEKVREQLGAKTNWVDSDDLSMMFRGKYNTSFYRALRDALHAEVDARNSQRSGQLGTDRPEKPELQASSVNLEELWTRVESLEKTCRNPHPTLVPGLAGSGA